ncbi:hypothetical protein ACIOGZ_29005 [Kitasatospora sp. NPDC088160]|uniref:hypothetical protein n=1 Tax=Kitasatospora sp. NPDC088160 TaxID=3364072 RepID=UPI003800A215
MSRYARSLDSTTSTQLEWGYDRPLHNVFAYLVIDDDFVDDRGLYPPITTVGELMPAIADMLTRNNVRLLTDEEAISMMAQLIADGADGGTLT